MQCNRKISRFHSEIDNFMLQCNMGDGRPIWRRALFVARSLWRDGAMRYREKQRKSTEPAGELASRTLAMPADSNPKGDIFGGWIMSLMESAGKMSAAPHAAGRGVTVPVSNITILQPVHVGDPACCCPDVKRSRRTSITLDV